MYGEGELEVEQAEGDSLVENWMLNVSSYGMTEEDYILERRRDS